MKVFKTTSRGTDVILELFGPGDPVGAVAVYESRPYPASAVALEPTTCLVIPRQAFFSLLEGYPTMVRGLLVGLTHRLVELTNRLTELSGGRVEGRLARFFLKLAHGHRSARATDGMFIPLALSRQELADMIGTTIETSIRIMSRWGKDGDRPDREGRVRRRRSRGARNGRAVLTGTQALQIAARRSAERQRGAARSSTAVERGDRGDGRRGRPPRNRTQASPAAPSTFGVPATESVTTRIRSAGISEHRSKQHAAAERSGDPARERQRGAVVEQHEEEPGEGRRRRAPPRACRWPPRPRPRSTRKIVASTTDASTKNDEARQAVRAAAERDDGAADAEPGDDRAAERDRLAEPAADQTRSRGSRAGRTGTARCPAPRPDPTRRGSAPPAAPE